MTITLLLIVGDRQVPMKWGAPPALPGPGQQAVLADPGSLAGVGWGHMSGNLNFPGAPRIWGSQRRSRQMLFGPWSR